MALLHETVSLFELHSAPHFFAVSQNESLVTSNVERQIGMTMRKENNENIVTLELALNFSFERDEVKSCKLQSQQFYASCLCSVARVVVRALTVVMMMMVVMVMLLHT